MSDKWLRDNATAFVAGFVAGMLAFAVKALIELVTL